MKPIYVKVSNNEIMYSNSENAINEKCFKFDNSDNLQTNLRSFKNKLSDSIDTIILIAPSEYLLKKNVITYNNKKIDLGSELENIFHIPVVNSEDVLKKGLRKAVEEEKNYTSWHLDYYGIENKKRQYGQESIQTIGNGFLGLRGSFLEAKANQDNYPATYIAGVFNQLATPINNRRIVNEDLVNLPNSQYFTFSIDNGKLFKIDKNLIKESLRSLDMKNGVLTITLLVKLNDGKELKIVEQKFADLKNYHNYYLKYSIQPLNFSGNIQIHTETDASITNSNVERYRNLANKHLSTDKIINTSDKSVLVLTHTTQSNIKLAIKTKLNYDKEIKPKYIFKSSNEIASECLSFEAKEDKIYTFEKNISIFTSLETKNSIEQIALNHQCNTFEKAINDSVKNWGAIWNQQDIIISGDITAQKLLRLNTYSMTSAAQLDANKDLDASVGSRGLTGEGYRGHIFWDELFDMNFYELHSPKLVKSLLMYRYNRLKAAIKYASDNHHQGAMYPWQSGMYGDEQSQEVHLNPITNKWDPDNSRKQRHVSLAIAYNIINYYNISEDETFIKNYGLEMLLEISKFWMDISQLDSKTGKYNIKNVMGPDEFHEGYPGKDNEGLTNNAYTNIMVSWLFKNVLTLVHDQPTSVSQNILQKTNLNQKKLQKINSIRHNLKLDFDGDILGQFEGYFKLKKLDFNKYRQQYGDISRMDRILKAHNDSPDNYQVAKQADTLMALFNMKEKTFFGILNDLGYPISDQEHFIEDNINYYLIRTTHGSTLSRIVYSMLLLKIGEQRLAWKLFYEALTSDYYDIQGGTTAEGIHLGVMGATLNVVTSFFAGVDYRGEMLEINPNLPKQWDEIDFNMTFKNINFKFQISKETISILSNRDTEIIFLGKNLPLTADQEIELTY